MKNIIKILIVVCLNFNATAQNITGKVLERISNDRITPIIGANVYWENTTVGTVTNNDGVYNITEAPSLPATLMVSFIGYEIAEQEVIDGEYIFYIQSSLELEEVNVKGKQTSSRFSTISTLNVQTLSTKELEKAACCNLSESFGTNATVDVAFNDAVSGAKRIKMLGLDGVYTQITQENLPLIRGLSSSFGLSYTPGPYIESIQIIKGAGSVVNGFESFAGQINLEYFKPSSSDDFYYNFYTNGEGKIENNLILSKKQGDWQSNLFTHFSYHDIERDKNKDGFIDMPGTKHFNFLNRWKYVGNPKYGIQFYARGFTEERRGGTLSDLSNTYPSADPFIVDINNKLLEFSSKTGLIIPSQVGKSIGIQTSFRVHSQDAQFGSRTFESLQKSAYINIIRQTFISDCKHQLKYGLSFYGDNMNDNLTLYNTASEGAAWYSMEIFGDNRTDAMTGIFSEYNYKWGETISLTAGVRADYYNVTGLVYGNPRLNIKYNPSEQTAIRFSGGRAMRVSNFISDNISLLASNREISFKEGEVLLPEIAWNYGANITHCFYILDREGSINIDFYRTEFENQIVVDIEQQGVLSFSNLNDGSSANQSFSNSLQFDLNYELFNRFDMKLAYKINNVKTTYYDGLKDFPLLAKNRALFNVSYSNKSDSWLFDATCNYIGESRIPEHQLLAFKTSDPFSLFNFQITKKINKFDFYLGGENLLNYTQDNPILDSFNSNSNNFDASLIWAPVMGRLIYCGIRFKIKN